MTGEGEAEEGIGRWNIVPYLIAPGPSEKGNLK
jgi:hypothetical protein